MYRTVRIIVGIALAMVVLGLLVVLLNPGARQLTPTWLGYDLIGWRYTPLPVAAEQWILAQGQDFCAVGRDSECGGYKIVRAQSLAVGSNAGSQATLAAWCVDYAVLRRNTGRLTSQFIYWVGIPRAMVVAEQSDQQYQGYPVERCDMTTLNP